MIKRRKRIKPQYRGWIVAAVLFVLLLAMPLDVFVRLAYETQQKAAITEELLITLTGTVKAGTALAIAAAAFVFYRVTKK